MNSIPVDNNPTTAPSNTAPSTAAPPAPDAATPHTSLPTRRAGATRDPAPAEAPAATLPSRPARRRPLPASPAPEINRGPARLAPLMLILFLAALVLITWAISIMRGMTYFNFLSRDLENFFRGYFLNYQQMIVGTALLLVGGIGAALAGRKVLTDRLAGLPLPIPRPRLDPIAIAAIALGVIACGTLFGLLIAGEYDHWFVLLFFGGIILFGVAVHRLDRRDAASTLRFERIDFLLAGGLALLSGIANCFDLTRWEFSWIGDEGAFFITARQIARGDPWDFFNLSGVYYTHPILDSAYQGLFLKLFGANVWSWRFAEVVTLSVSAILVYFVGLALFGRLQGFVAAVVLGFSHYLMAFTRIAYNNTHILFWATLAILMLALAWRTQRAVFVYLLGVAMGFCLYTFQAAILIWPVIAIVLLIIFFRKPSWALAFAGLLMLFAFAIVVLPGLLTTPLDHLIQVAIANSRREVALTNPGLVARVSIAQSLAVWWENNDWRHHYVGGPLLDTLSGVLFAAGLFIGLFRINKRGERLAVVWFVVGIVMLSVSNYVPGPSLTRLLFLMPPVALLIGVAVAKLERLVRATSTVSPQLARGLVVAPLVLLIPALNIWQLQVDTPQEVSTTPQTMVMKAIQEHPQYKIYQVGTAPDQNTYEMLRYFAWFTDNYRFVRLEEVIQPYPEGPGGYLPIYMVDSRSADLVQPLADKLPAYYKLSVETDALDGNQIWLFTPDPNAKAPPAPTTGPTLSTLDLLAEFKLPAGATEPRDVATDTAGNIYVAASGDNTIYKFDPTGKLLLSWGNNSGQQVFAGLFGIAIDAHDTIYALDNSTGQIMRFDSSGKALGNPIKTVSYSPRGLSVTPDGEALLADTGTAQVIRYDAKGEVIDSRGGSGAAPGQFIEPTDVLLTSQGEMFVYDSGNARIQRFGPGGAFLGQWSITPNLNSRESGHMALDQFGRLFVTSPTTGDVYAYSPVGQILYRWPQNEVSAPPVGIYIDEQNNLYVTYPLANTIRKYHIN